MANVILLCLAIGFLSGLAAGAAQWHKPGPSRIEKAYQELITAITSLDGWKVNLTGNNLAELRFNGSECVFFLSLRRSEKLISILSTPQYAERVYALMDDLHPSGIPADIEVVMSDRHLPI